MEVAAEVRAGAGDRDLTDILSYAITGEFIGMANYADMAALLEDSGEQIEAALVPLTEPATAGAIQLTS
jgi:hypothetical protein